MGDAGAQIDPEALLAHGDFVRAIARSLLWDEHAAEDVVQQTWIAALGAPVGTSRGWLGTVARNLAIKRLRGDRRRVAREALAARPEGVPSDEEVRERERLRRGVVDEVLALEEPYRATILLRYFEGLPPRDVARRMNAPVETVRTRTRRALDLLRVRLDARHGDDRDSFCAALAAWAGPRQSSGSGGSGAATAAVGVVMKAKIAAACLGLVALCVGAYLMSPQDEVRPAAPEKVVASESELPTAPRPRTPRPRATEVLAASAPSPQSTTAPKPIVAGRVVDTHGDPVAGAVLRVDGPGTSSPDPKISFVSVTTGADGRYEAPCVMGKTCRLIPWGPVGLIPTVPGPREVTAPADGIDFVVERKPTATLVITAFDVDAARQSTSFGCYVHTPFGLGMTGTPSGSTGTVEHRVCVSDPAGDPVRVVVTNGVTAAAREVVVRPDDRVDVHVELSCSGLVAGRVIDKDGSPLAGVLVFFGEEDVARGDEPFKPWDENRVTDGVRTGADGRFELTGPGRCVTFWRAGSSPVTGRRDSAVTNDVQLPALGAIRGVLRSESGAAVAITKVFLDRVRETTTDSEGRFEFTGVEAGTRGLSLTGGKPKAYVAVRVTAGAAVDVELRPGLPSVRVEWPGRTNLGRFVGLVPVATVGSLGMGQPSGGAFTVNDLLPGRYILLGEGGAVAQAEITGPSATALVGSGEIVVHAKPKTRLWVVPEGAGYLARLLAGRMAGAGVPADGVQHFTGLAPGRYEVGVERDGVRTSVEVNEGAVETTIE